jgi:hypothetical protein
MCNECWLDEPEDELEEVDFLRSELDAVKADLAKANTDYISLWKAHEARGEKIFELQGKCGELREDLMGAKAELGRKGDQQGADVIPIHGAWTDVALDNLVDQFRATWTSVALELLGDTLQSKRSDYSVDNEFGNFEAAAEAASIKAEDVMLAQVGIKLGRIKNLRDMDDTPHYEPLLDSYKDLAGYAILAYAHALKWAEGGGNEKGIHHKDS